MSMRRSAFTLIELLVVVSILTLLISLLLPGLRNARQSARGAQCRSNQRSCAAAANTYATDMNGLFLLRRKLHNCSENHDIQR